MGVLPPSDTNLISTGQVRLHPHLPLVWLVRQAEAKTLVQIRLFPRLGAAENARDAAQAVYWPPDVEAKRAEGCQVFRGR